MKSLRFLFAVCALFTAAEERVVGWNFAVWPTVDASQWAPPLGLTNVVSVAAGSDRTLFVRADGSVVWSLGGSWSGTNNIVKASSWCHDVLLLADSTVIDWGLGGCAGSAPYTTMPPGLSNVTAIAAGDRHTLVLKQDGTCVSWGWMTVSAGYVPDGLNNVVAVAAGFDTSAALKSDGSVAAWGYSGYGGTAAPAGLTDGMAVALGHHHGLVLRSNGVVVTWSTTPPPGLTNVTKIAAQQTWSLVLKDDGHLVAWNDGIGSQHLVPTQPLTNVLEISAGSYHGVVLVGDGPPQPLWTLSNQVAIAGASVTFPGEALGTEPLSYQWRCNGTNLPGATSPTLTLNAVTPSQAGTYTLFLSNAFGVLTNVGGSLSVLPFHITADPTNATLFGGDTFVNRIAVEGKGLSYQWRKNGADLPDQTAAILTISNLTTNDTGNYSVAVSNIFGATVSSAASLAVVPIIIEVQPADRTVFVGESTTFSVAAQRNGPFTYQWRFNGGDLPGQTAQTLVLGNITEQQGGSYSVLVSNPYGSIESTHATLLVVDSAPIIISQPRNTTTWPGGTVNLQIDAAGSLPLSYQWRFNGRDLPGATRPTLTVSAATTNEVGTYSILVSNAVGTALSANASLTLVPVVLWPTELLSLMPLSPALSNAVAVSAGSAFNLALKSDGKVLAWGANDQGQTNVPPGLSNVAAIATGDSHGLALRTNGTVVSWGSNSYGQTNVPQNLTNVIAIAAADVYSMALREDGTAVAWGRIDYSRSSAAVPGMDWNGVISIAAGQFHRMGLRPDGSVVVWIDYFDYGLNRAPSGLSNVVAVAAGGRHSLALKADGTLVAWGDTANGLTNIPRGLSNVVAIACGSAHNLALKADGSVIGWGFTGGYGLTNAAPTSAKIGAISVSGHNLALLAPSDPAIIRRPRSISAAPFQPVLFSVGAISARPLSYRWQFNGENIPDATNAFYRIAAVSQAHQGEYRVVVSNELGVLASPPADLKVNGVIAWGWNAFRQTNIPAALRVSGLSAGYGHSLGLRPDGRIVAWGTYNTAVTNVPVTATNVSRIASGPNHNLALKADGRVIAWGNSSSATAVPANLSNVVMIAAADNDSLALKIDGTLTHFGTFAAPPAWLSNVVSIAAGDYYKLALRSDGSVVTWPVQSTPIDLSNVVDIAAARYSAAGVRKDGTVVTWGSPPLPAPPGLSNVISIAAGNTHLLALKSDGTMVSWGTSPFGDVAAPPGWSNVVSIAGGYAHSLMSIDNHDPFIVRSPASARASSGNQVLFSVGARSRLPVQFQWGFNGTNIPAATNSWLLIPEVQARNAGLYRVKISNGLGSLSTPPATLEVFDQKPFIRTQPASTSASRGSSAVFQVVAEGSEPKQYQWLKQGTALEAATAATLTLLNVQRADEALYSVIVSNAFGVVSSTQGSLHVMVPQLLHAPVLNSDGTIAFLFGDSDGGLVSEDHLQYFQLLRSTNLVDWEFMTNRATFTNGVFHFRAENVTDAPLQYYRVQEWP